jgi:hypothetical protein
MFSEVSDGRSRQVRQFTMPSLLEKIDVAGTGKSPAMAFRSSELSSAVSPDSAS